VREINVDDEAHGIRETVSAPTAAPDAIADTEAIQAAFLELNPDARAILALHYVEGRSVAEIAHVMQIPVGTVKWRLFRARQVLDGALKRQDR